MGQEEHTKEYYDAIARGYSELYHKEQEKKIGHVCDLFPSKGVVVDLGSGDGVINKFLKEDIELISLDLSINLLRLNGNVNKINASATSLPFKDEIADFLISFTAIQDIPDTHKVIKEMARILKPNSEAVISFLKNSRKRKDISEGLERYFHIEKQIEEEKDIILLIRKK